MACLYSKSSSPWRESARKVSATRRHNRGRLFPDLGSFPSSASRSIGQPLAFGASEGEIGPLNVVNAKSRPVAVAEIELGKIPLKMGWRDMLIHAIDAALQDGEVTFDSVGIDFTAHVFLGAVEHGAMLCEVPSDMGVDLMFVGNEAAVLVGMTRDERPEACRSDARNVKAADLPATLDQRHDRLLGRGRAIGAAFMVAPDVGLVGLDGLPSATKRRGEDIAVFLHGFPNPMAQKPGGLHAAAQGALKLARADALLRGRHEVDHLQPHPKRHMAGLEDGANAYSEGLTTGVALPKPGAGALAAQSASLSDNAAMGTHRTVRPQPSLDIGDRGLFVVEMLGGKD